MVLERKIGVASVSMNALDPLDHGLELLHFGFRGLTRDADRYLDAQGLSRGHTGFSTCWRGHRKRLSARWRRRRTSASRRCIGP